MKKSFAEMLEEEAAALRRKMEAKLPEWAGVEGLEYPTRLCTEQCSSSATARYKASLLASQPGLSRGSVRPMVADLTGGLGVDSWAFSRAGMDVWYNEMNAELSAAAGRNFARLGADNISVHSLEVTEDNISALLEQAHPDAVYMDPARRSATGGKVFRIADCTPNVLGIKDAILDNCGLLMLKLSPMADISQVVRELDSELGHVAEVHIVGAAGECKELLVLLRRAGECPDEPRIKVASDGAEFSFESSEEAQATAGFASDITPGMTMFEPGSALAKSGAFNLISARHGLAKADVSTHLYFFEAAAYGTPAGPAASSGSPADLAGLGKFFSVKEVLPFNNASSRELASRRLNAEVTARGLQLSSEALAKRLGIKGSSSDGRLHIFGISTRSMGKLLLVTERLAAAVIKNS